MNLKAKSLMIMSLAVIMSACNTGVRKYTIEEADFNDGYGLAGRLARAEYHGLLSQSVGDLNYMKTAQSANAQHFANFVDGLLLHNSYGALDKNLAEKVTHNDDYTEFTFTVRDGVKWQRFDGSQYKANVNGVKTPQFVRPSDFRTTAEMVLNPANGSEVDYLVGTFIKGAYEYYYYMQLKAEAKEKGEQMPDDTGAAKEINKRIRKEKPAVWELEYDSGAKQLTATDIPNIKNGSRLGIITDDNARTITYKLNQQASFFPTLFTYSCFLPTNQYFMKDVGWANFGTAKDKILYCGPYLLSKVTDTAVEYKANKEYWNAENTLVVDKVKFGVITGSVSNDYVRKEFEADRVDGFTISYDDQPGWKKYVTGDDEENPGTIENPISPYVNSRLLDTIGNCYGSSIVMDRDLTGSGKSYATEAGGSETTVKNTARALSIKEVRKAVIYSLDFKLYFDRHFSGYAKALRNQQKVYTYVPKGFVVDSEGNDYVTTYYYNEYAAQKNLAGGAGDPENPQPGTAAYELQPGQNETCTLTKSEVAELVQDAIKAVQLYNSNHSKKISFPINIEYYSNYFDPDSKDDDEEIIEDFNDRLNSEEALEGTGIAKAFNVIPTTDCSKSNYSTISGSNGGKAYYDYAPVQWGWGADYGDPLTYMNTFVKGGDWSSVFPFISEATIDNFEMNEAKNALIQSDLLENYTALVAEGARETNDISARYEKFAKAEYSLINDLCIYLPQTNNGQGWSLSVSRSAGYFMPTGSYGLSNDRFTGLYILDEVMTRTERQAARDKQQADKDAFFQAHNAATLIYED